MKLLLLTLALTAYATVTAADPSKQVLNYYANETHLNEAAQRNYDKLIDVLSADKEGAGPELTPILESDLKRFPLSVDEETKALGEVADKATKLNIMVFTNRLSQRGRYLLHRSGSDGWQEQTFSYKPSDNYIAQSHPNALPATLRAALKEAAKKFDPSAYSFSLITKSHANSDFILVPRVTIPHETMTPREILDVANKISTFEGIAPWSAEVSTTTSDYIDALRDAGDRLNMKFYLVFAEGCNGRAGLPKDKALPTNIQTLIVPSEDLDYTTIDYRVAFADGQDPIANITEQAAKRVPNDVATLKPAKRSLWEIALWWLPLVIVLGAFLLRRILLRRWMARAGSVSEGRDT